MVDNVCISFKFGRIPRGVESHFLKQSPHTGLSFGGFKGRLRTATVQSKAVEHAGPLEPSSFPIQWPMFSSPFSTCQVAELGWSSYALHIALSKGHFYPLSQPLHGHQSPCLHCTFFPGHPAGTAVSHPTAHTLLIKPFHVEHPSWPCLPL